MPTYMQENNLAYPVIPTIERWCKKLIRELSSHILHTTRPYWTSIASPNRPYLSTWEKSWNYTCIASSHTTKVSMGLIQLLILNKPLFFSDMWLGVDLRMDTKKTQYVEHFTLNTLKKLGGPIWSIGEG